jgi:exodeoxyribonuclease VII large subunit
MLEQDTATVLTVEQLNRQIRQMIEGQLDTLWVQGEISNFKAHTSGHYYFSLKDSKSQISAVMFRGHNSRLKFRPKDGDEVLVRGKVTVYEPRGNYQIMAEAMEPVGAGALQKAFEQLKEKLKKEGLFETARKRPLPAHPKHIAIVTSPTGAAIRDMLNILARRNRSSQVTVVPTVVQGATAAPQIVAALKLAYRIPDVDVIIVGRGGGSIEDMWCFNDEALARTIAESPVPIVSAVGHEIDFTISDFVADLRAPTPSAAAELVSKNSEEIFQRLGSLRRFLDLSMAKHLKLARQKLNHFEVRLVDPKRKLQDLALRNDDLFNRLSQAMNFFVEKRKMRVALLHEGLTSPRAVIDQKKSQLQMLKLRMNQNMKTFLKAKTDQLSQSVAVLNSMSPLKVVERGYSMAKTKGKILKKANQVQVGEKIELTLMQGRLEAQVTQIFEDEK